MTEQLKQLDEAVQEFERTAIEFQNTINQELKKINPDIIISKDFPTFKTLDFLF